MGVGDERLSVTMVRGYDYFELHLWYDCHSISCRDISVLILIGLLGVSERWMKGEWACHDVPGHIRVLIYCTVK